MDAALKRRDLLRLIGAAAFTTLQLPAAEPNAPLFFTKEEFALLDTLTELIIPADDHSPGAHDAGVAVFIDRMTAEAFLPEEKTTWRKGLAAIDGLSRQMYQAPFLGIAKDRQTALLGKLAGAEPHPQTEPEKFFTQVKETMAFVYYSSSIGIHQEINYLGNVYLDQFKGYEAD